MASTTSSSISSCTCLSSSGFFVFLNLSESCLYPNTELISHSIGYAHRSKTSFTAFAALSRTSFFCESIRGRSIVNGSFFFSPSSVIVWASWRERKLSVMSTQLTYAVFEERDKRRSSFSERRYFELANRRYKKCLYGFRTDASRKTR